jgi:hypothetical protein
MKIVRSANAPAVVSEFAAQRHMHFQSIHADIELPLDSLVEMIDRLLLRVQAGLRPRVTWERHDSWVLHNTTMRWYMPGAQLELAVSAGSGTGFNVWLYPHFVFGCGGDYNTSLAHWTMHRVDSTYSWRQEDYGKLEIHRGERVGPRFGDDYRVTRLQFEDPVLEGIQRVEPKPYAPPVEGEPPELGADIIAVTQGYIDAAKAA